jgi:hypothetical protein
VVVDSVHYGTHEWVLTTDTNANTNEEVWGFLKRFSLNGTAGSLGRTISTVYNLISATYCSGVVRLNNVTEDCLVQVIDTKGRLVVATAVGRRQFAFRNKPGGVYIIRVSGTAAPFTLRMVIP